MTQQQDEHVSDFAKAVAERFAARKATLFNVDGYFGLGGKPIPQIGILTPSKRAEVAAIDQAHALAKTMCAQPEARSDADVLSDLKMTCVLFAACRDAKDQRYPAFPGPEWMHKNLTGDQLSAIANLVNQVRVKDSPAPLEITDEQVEAWATVCSSHVGSGLPSAQLAGCPREYLEYLVVALSEKLATDRARLADAAKGGLVTA
jgi:hypothetical protein